MICPRCKNTVPDNSLVCPHCQKVIKIQCPNCKAIGTSSICEECGRMLLIKCYKCKKINNTSILNCPNCGFSTAASIALRESLISEFASLTIEFENKAEIDAIFEDKKQAIEFNKNIFVMIKSIAIKNKVRLQNIDNVLIVRFCKNSDFESSCRTALEFAIEVSQAIIDINAKLQKLKNVSIKVRMAIQKRDINSHQTEYKSGVNIKLLYDYKKEEEKEKEVLSNMQILVDTYVYQEMATKYSFLALSSVFVKNEMVMLYELLIKDLITIPEDEDKKNIDELIAKLPDKVNYEAEILEDVTDKNFDYSDVKAQFKKIYDCDLENEIKKSLYIDNPKNKFIAVRTKDALGKIEGVDFSSIKNYQIFELTCTEGVKYRPYGLICDLILAFYGADKFAVLFGYEKNIALNKYLNALLTFSSVEHKSPEEIRAIYKKVFEEFFNNIVNKTLFVIYDFENADEGSLEILKEVLNFEKMGNANFVVSCSENYLAHKKLSHLVRFRGYTEYEVVPSSNKSIILKYKKVFENIGDSYSITKVLENTKGSAFYFETALDLLVESEIIERKAGRYNMLQNTMLVISPNIDKLVEKRLLNLKKNTNEFSIYLLLLALAPKVSLGVLNLFSFEDIDKILKDLVDKNYIKIENNCILVKHYNLYYRNTLNIIKSEDIIPVIAKIQTNVMDKIIAPYYFSSIMEYGEEDAEFLNRFDKYAKESLCKGDLSSYFSCLKKYLERVQESKEFQKTADKQKVIMQKYDEIADVLYKYYPEKVFVFLHLLLENIELTSDDGRIKDVCSKILECSVNSKNYTNILEYIAKIVAHSQAEEFRLSPMEKFNLSAIKLQAYYNLGRLSDAISLGSELLEVLSKENLREFEKQKEEILFYTLISLLFKFPSKIDNEVVKIESFALNSDQIEIVKIIIDVLRDGKYQEYFRNFVTQKNKYSQKAQIFIDMFNVIVAFLRKDWNLLADKCYNGKVSIKDNSNSELVNLYELLIGFAYKKAQQYKKSQTIYNDIYKISSDNSQNMVKYLSLYMLADMEYENGNHHASLEILDSFVLNLEKDENSSNLFLMMIKELIGKNLMELNSSSKALSCLKNALKIAEEGKLLLNVEKYEKIIGSFNS